jgi:hypothetical protein
MALDGLFRFPRLPAAPAGNEDTHSDGDWDERLVTTVAVSAAVLVVASIAVLMGLASP